MKIFYDSWFGHAVCANGVQRIHDGQFKWDAPMQAFVLASFYYGYITTTLLGGILAVR